MLSFKEFFLNENIKFKRGINKDYMKGDELLVFSPKDVAKYKIEGNTHDQTSHSIKHIVEFDEDFMETELERARNIIRNYLTQDPYAYCRLWNRSNNSYYRYEHLDALKHTSDDALLNTFDMINDKRILHQEINDAERALFPVLNSLSLKYHNIINNIVDSAADLNAPRTVDEYVEEIQNARVIH